MKFSFLKLYLWGSKRCMCYTMECSCCFTEIAPRKHVRCSSATPHVFCRACPKKALDAEISQGKITYKCIGDADCTGIFSESERRFYLSRRQVARVSRIEIKSSIAQAGIDNLVTCGLCDYTAEYEDISGNLVVCGNPDCEESICVKCSREYHRGPCVRDEATRARVEAEERETRKVSVTCPRCSVSIVKTEGCNKIVCACKAYVCYLCGKDISEEGYTHFYAERGGSCRLFSEKGEANELTPIQAYMRAQANDSDSDDLVSDFDEQEYEYMPAVENVRYCAARVELCRQRLQEVTERIERGVQLLRECNAV